MSSHCTRCCAKLKMSSQRQLPSKKLVKFGKNYNQFGPREPDRLPLCCRSHCSPFQHSGLVQIQSKQFSITRLIYECGDSRCCLPLCVWLRAVLQAWRHVKPVWFRFENIFCIMFTEHSHFYHSCFYWQIWKGELFFSQPDFLKEPMRRSSSAWEYQSSFALCGQQMSRSFRKTNSVWMK